MCQHIVGVPQASNSKQEVASAWAWRGPHCHTEKARLAQRHDELTIPKARDITLHINPKQDTLTLKVRVNIPYKHEFHQGNLIYRTRIIAESQQWV